jgi:superfamily II RNA helicase
MVKQCDQIYPQNILYDQYFEKYPYPLSDFQKWAIQGIVEGNHVLVTAHTGSGKTLPAEFAIEHFTSKSKKVIYTAPIKALSNQKFYEFTNKYPHISFGLFTGDIKINPTADVIIGLCNKSISIILEVPFHVTYVRAFRSNLPLNFRTVRIA